jgi:hypothetical protein
MGLNAQIEHAFNNFIHDEDLTEKFDRLYLFE